MADSHAPTLPAPHSHVFLGASHAHAERRTWAVIWLCGAMMALEIIGGALFGSIALVADGLHMSTHAGALLLAALAYSYARQHAADPRFSFGTGKLGDLAGFTSAVILAMIALLIGYEAVIRVITPVPIRFGEAIPIAVLGLGVNVASAWLLAGGDHHHHGHGHHHHDQVHGHAADGHVDGEEHSVATVASSLLLSIFENDHPPVFRLRSMDGELPAAQAVSIETQRPDGARQVFTLKSQGSCLQSIEVIPEPHTFVAHLRISGSDHPIVFEEHDHNSDDIHAHGAAHHDNNMRAAIVHVIADATVSVLVIVGLLLARAFGWLWMDPLAGVIGACVIASWSYGLIRDTGAILLDMRLDPAVEQGIRRTVEDEGDRLTDLHIWRLGPGHLGAIVSVATGQARSPDFYRERLARFRSLSHVTVEVQRAA